MDDDRNNKEKAQVIRFADGLFLTFLPGLKHQWKTRGPSYCLDRKPKPRRELFHRLHSLQASTVKWWVDRLPLMLLSI